MEPQIGSSTMIKAILTNMDTNCKWRSIYSQHYEASKAFLTEQQPNDPLNLSRVLECRLVIDPATFKNLVHWLTGLLKAFESQYGQIPTPEEIQQKIASIEAENKKKTTGASILYLLISVIILAAKA
jgi:hypothetical protein